MDIIRFCLVGALNTAIDFTVFAILTAWGVSLFPAHAFAYACGIVNSFILNRRWTFQIGRPDVEGQGWEREMVKQLSKFIFINLASLGLTYGLLVWFHLHWGWPLLLSRILAAAVSFLLNFAGSRLWVFRKTHLKSELA